MRLKVLASVGLFISLLVVVIVYAVNSALESMPPLSADTIKHLTITLTNGMKVQEEEKTTHQWDGFSYRYTFTHAGRVIASTAGWSYEPEPLFVQKGQSQNIPYFFQRNRICLYDKGAWIVWDDLEESVAPWYADLQQDSTGRDVDRGAGIGVVRIKKFRVEGPAWIIEVDTCARGDWSNGVVPPLVHMISTDHGKAWHVRETPVRKQT